jgi:hypothetical protein
VLSELMRPTPHPRVVARIAKQSTTELFTTSITEAEIFYGLELLAKGKRREGLLAAAEAMFAEDLADRVLGFDSASFFQHCRSPPRPRQTYQSCGCADRIHCPSGRGHARDSQRCGLRGLELRPVILLQASGHHVGSRVFALLMPSSLPVH